MTETKRDIDLNVVKTFDYMDFEFSPMDISYTTKENGEALCTCVYAYENGICMIKYLASKDGEDRREFERLTLMAVLNEADLGGVLKSVSFNDDLFPLLKSCLFKEDVLDSKRAMCLELEGYFDCGDLEKI